MRTKDENGSIENINYDENDSLNVCLVQLKRKENLLLKKRRKIKEKKKP